MTTTDEVDTEIDDSTSEAIDIIKNLPQRLRESREGNNMTLKQLGKLIGCAPEMVCRIEHGDTMSGKTLSCCIVFIHNTPPGQIFWTLRQAESIHRDCRIKRSGKSPTTFVTAELFRRRWIRDSGKANGVTADREAVLRGYLIPGVSGELRDMCISLAGMLEIKKNI